MWRTWLLFGIIAIIAAILNVIWTVKKRDAKWFRFISLSCTALTLCGQYNLIEHKYMIEDWNALMDILPGTSTALWRLTIASVAINGISLFKKGEK